MNETDDQLIARVAAMEQEAGEIAMQHIAEFQPFASLPDTVNARLLEDFGRLAQARGMSKTETVSLLRRDVEVYVRRLRATTLNLANIGAVRLAVLIHVAAAITVDEVTRIPGLIDALRHNRFDDASDYLQLSRWPSTATKPDEQRRILELARMMRTGMPPAAWLH